MATTYNPKYGTPATIGVSTALDSLANGSAAQSDSLDNATNRYADGKIEVVLNGLAGSVASVSVYVAESIDGTNFVDGASGSAGAFTLANLDNAVLLGAIQMNGATAIRAVLPRTLRSVLGSMPLEFALIFVNNSGAALAASGAAIKMLPLDVEVVTV
jgi:hypothetical protein